MIDTNQKSTKTKILYHRYLRFNLESRFVLLLKDKIFRGTLIAILLVSASFFMFSVPQISAASELVTATATNHDQVTVVEYKNNEGNIFEITSIVLKVDKGGEFKSFKTERGWIGKKTSADTITFTSALPVKPGQSAKFGIKTDKFNPVFNWKAFDKEGDELGSGGKIETVHQNDTSSETETKTTEQPTTMDHATFKIIPDTPRVGSTLRIIGEGFGPNEKLDFYINDFKLDSFVSDGSGNFVVSTKIPEHQLADRADFIIKDLKGNQKSLSFRIQSASSRVIAQELPLTVNADSVYHRGEEKTLSGTATPGSTLSISESNPDGKVLTTYTVKADSTGIYSTKQRVPSDRPFGEYTVTITDGKNTVVHKYSLESTQKIFLATLKEKYDPGETVVFNGTALANQEMEIEINDPTGAEVYSTNIIVGENGTLTFDYPLDNAVREGTYALFATQGNEHVTILFGVGQLPASPLIATMNALNYKTTDRPEINIIGPPSSTVNLIIIDPSDKQKFTDSFSLGTDGYRTYAFNLIGYTSGVYTAVISRGNVHAENLFSVGLQTSTGSVTLRTLQETYYQGDSVLMIGNSNPNVIITLSLTDPNGNKVKTQDVFTDKKGTFSSSIFRIPSNAQIGVWKLEAGSGINHVSKDLTILEKNAESNLTIHLDKTTSYAAKNVMTISGGGAGKSHNVVITILKSDQTEIVKLTIVATGVGSYSTIWNVPSDLTPGPYTIKATDDKKSAETTFTVQ
jgi:hypothetical protein